MGKKEKFYKEIQTIAKTNLGNFDDYINELQSFLVSQTILKKTPKLTPKIQTSIYFYELYRVDQDKTKLWQSISQVCLSSMKHVAIDDVYMTVITS